MAELEADWKFKQSCGEPELLPYVEEGLGLIQNQLDNLGIIESKQSKNMSKNKSDAK